MRRVSLSALLLLCTCGWRQQDADFTEADLSVIEQMVLEPLPPPDPVQAMIGQQLFFDTELSASINTSHDGQPMPLTGLLGTTGDAGADGGYLDGGLMLLVAGRVSCADCHLPDSWFSDDRSSPNNVSLGLGWTARNSPSLVNVAHYQGTFAWDGRSTTLAQQCAVAYTAGKTMAGSSALLAKVVQRKYADSWADAGAALDAGDDAIARAAYQFMAAYLTALESANAPIDQYAAGDHSALTETARHGLKLFIGKAGCIECHRGPAFTDNQYHNIGIAQRGEHVPGTDRGRFDAIEFRRMSPLIGCDAGCETNDPANVGLFRTKSLRQVAKSAPYMHAGQLATLADVVHFYNVGGDPGGFSGTRAAGLVPLGLTQEEENDLVAFLEALTGKVVPAGLRCDSSRDGGVHRYGKCPGAAP